MAFVVADRVKESTTSTGTGTVTLDGAGTGYQTFSAGVGANNTTFYTIASGASSQWEVGIGTVGAGGTTLTRDTILASSTGSIIDFTSGAKDIFCGYPAGRAMYAYGGIVTAGVNGFIFANPNTVTSDTTVPTDYNGVSGGPITVNSGVTVTVPSGSTWTIV